MTPRRVVIVELSVSADDKGPFVEAVAREGGDDAEDFRAHARARVRAETDLMGPAGQSVIARAVANLGSDVGGLSLADLEDVDRQVAEKVEEERARLAQPGRNPDGLN